MDPEDPAALFAEALDRLRFIAGRLLARQRPNHTLQPTALVNEAYLRLVQYDQLPRMRDGEHLEAVAAVLMRRLLIDHERARRAETRGGRLSRRHSTEAESLGRSCSALDEAEVRELLEQLAATHERAGRVVMLHYVSGCPLPQVAEAMRVSLSTVERDWRFACAWLAARLLPQLAERSGADAANPTAG